MAGLSRLIAKELSEMLGTTVSTKADDTVEALGKAPTVSKNIEAVEGTASDNIRSLVQRPDR